MTIVSGFFGFLLGLPLGIVLFLTRKGQLLENNFYNRFLSVLVNVFRSIPFIILIVWMIPFTRVLVDFHWNLGSPGSSKYWLCSVYCTTGRKQPFGGSKWIDRNGKSSWGKSSANYQQSFTSRGIAFVN